MSKITVTEIAGQTSGSDQNLVKLPSNNTLQVDNIVNRGGDNDSGVDLSSNDVVAFKTANAERVRVDSSGNVGIGTSAPSDSTNNGDNLVIGGESNVGMSFLSNATSGNGAIYFADGTSGTAAYRGILSYSHSDDAMDFGTASTAARVRIDSSGRLLLGTTTPSSYSNRMMTVAGNDDATIEIRANPSNGHSQLVFSDGTAADNTSQRGYIIYDHPEETFKFGAYDKEVMRFDSNGHMLVGTTSDGGVGNTFKNTGQQRMAMSGTSAFQIVQFANGNGQVGTIVLSGSSTSFNTSSDYRLKENVVTDWDATSRLKQLKPSRFNFKADKDTTVDGFLAHEVSSIVPEAISGDKDAMTKEVLYIDGDEIPEGKKVGDVKTPSKIDPQSIDQSKLVPLLTKALQEAISEIDTLKEKVTALESK